MATNSQKLRQKAINLLYLIFLAFLFTFIPSDFVDTTYITNQSMNMLCNEVERHSTKYNMLVLSYVQQDEELFNDTKLKIIQIDELTNEQIKLIEDMKVNMIKKQGFNTYGYLTSGKSENPSNDFMITEKNAEKLLNSLRSYKRKLIEFLPAEDVAYLDSILPLPERIRRSDGDFAPIAEFFFKKNPLNVALLNLSYFKSTTERARTYTISKVIQDIVITKPRVVPEDIAEIIMEQRDLLGDLEFIRAFRASRNRGGGKGEFEQKGQSIPLAIESVSDSIYAVGKPAKFNVKFDTASGKRIAVTLRKANGSTQNISMTKPGVFMFVPEEKGVYQIQFTSNEERSSKFIKVMDLDPVLQNNEMGTLYVGVDNALNIKTSEFEDTEGLQAQITKGVILKKGSNFYARVEEPGYVDVQVFAQMSYGKVKVAEKRFIVRELAMPVALLLNKTSGSTLTADELKKIKTLSIRSEEYLVSEQFYISGFDFSVIYNNHTSILQPITNSGSSLNAISQDALARVKPGDILIFSNIKAKSSLGKEIDVSPVTYTVK
ncbi:MAG: hypothetical protein H6608_00320 [Flavobacteriales bacterium]|nr:hypothetical protein [Bacteroidota bacterium]MCB9239552.1 hypothetical protein [Flavobacteriales bacterium]